MNTKKEQLIYLDIAVDQDSLGRIIIEPLLHPQTAPFARIFYSKDFLLAGGDRKFSTNGFAQVCEVKSHSYVKFQWEFAQHELENSNFNANGAELSRFVEMDTISANNTTIDLNIYSDLPSGVVICDEESPVRFSVLKSRWSPNDFRGVIVGRIFKGMSLIAHLSSIETNSAGKPVKNCRVIDIGVVPPESSLGLKKRDALLDHYPTLPQDATTIDFTDIDRVLTVGYTIKASGSLLFRQEKYQMAMSRFSKAVRYLTYAGEKQKLTREQEVRLLSLVVPCILNSAACKIKCKDFDGAMEDCNEALEINPGNAKIYFRRGQAHHGKMNYEQSLLDLYTALKISPNDKSIKNEIAAVEGEMQVYKKRKGSKTQSQPPMQSP